MRKQERISTHSCIISPEYIGKASFFTLLFIQAKISEIFPVVSDNFLGTMSPRPRGKKQPDEAQPAGEGLRY